jgi:general secretion pathway protein L
MRILSLDIGTYAVKATVINSVLGRLELEHYVNERVLEMALEEVEAKKALDEITQEIHSKATDLKTNSAQTPTTMPRQILSAGQLAALRRVLSELSHKIDKVVVQFPRTWNTSRVYQLPSKDRKVIQSSLAFELEDDIPFEIGDITYDTAILNQENNQSTVFAAVALKQDVRALLTDLNLLDVDPDMITVEPFANAYLLKKINEDEAKNRPTCIVNIGHRNSSIQVFLGNNPVLIHTSSCAGYEITTALAQHYNLNFDQAERSKIDSGFVLTQAHLDDQTLSKDLTDDQKNFSAVISNALVPLVRELKQTMMSFKSQYGFTPKQIFLTGGTAQIQNIGLFLEEQVRLPVSTFHYISKIAGDTLKLSLASESVLSNAVGLALNAIKPERNFSINFRKEEFQKKASIGTFELSSLKRPLKYAAASLVFIYMNLIAQSYILSSKLEDQNLRFESAIKSVLGVVNNSMMTSYTSSPSALKTAVNKEIAKYKDLAQPTTLKPALNGLEGLKAVSQKMPRDMQLDVALFNLESNQLKLTGTVDSLNHMPRILSAITSTGLFTEATQQKAQEDPKTKKVNFEIIAKVATNNAGGTNGTAR